MHGRGLVIGVAVVLVALAAGAAFVTREPGPRGKDAVDAAATLREPAGGWEGYARATTVRPFHFPEDHGPHPEFRTEWWYWTGNLRTEDGRDFGYQFTLFRTALVPEAPERASAWGSSQLYMGHFALSDIQGGRFHAFERFSREALGLAGARAEPFRVWLEDWSAEATGPGALPMRLRAKAAGVTLELELEQGKPPVLQGDRGLSQKGPEPGNASYYYSLTRMPSRGRVTVEGRTFEVTGLSWMDREWSTSALGENQVGWDWFALQLSDGSELVYGQLRQRDGTVDPYNAGTFIPPQGEPVRLKPEDVRLEVQDTWRSPRSGVSYPSRWHLTVPSQGLELRFAPALADQELAVSVRYWEGAVRIEGTRAGQPVTGRGYVELTGYGDKAQRER
jgi:predicted secreted hydrolase